MSKYQESTWNYTYVSYAVKWTLVKKAPYVSPSQRLRMYESEVIEEILKRANIDLSRSASDTYEAETEKALDFINHVYRNQDDEELLNLLSRWLIHTHTRFFSYVDNNTLKTMPVFFWEQLFDTADWHVQVNIIERMPLHIFVCMVNSGFIEDRYGDGFTMPDVIKRFRKRPELKKYSKELLHKAIKEANIKVLL